MPTYEYRCSGCGNAFEKFQRMSDEPVADCPACGAKAERRISGGAGLVFKGSGFYITDYARGDSYKKAAQADSGSSSSGASEGGASSSGGPDKPAAPAKPAESKPAPKND
jgi:putative FmdB family regulatory protein